MLNINNDLKIVVVGLGYVGLPLAIEFSKKFKVLGYDINKQRVEELIKGFDKTNELSYEELNKTNLKFSSDKKDIKNHNVFIVTVPTPINKYKSPDLNPLINSSTMIGEVLKKGNFVIYESTVYPGCTEEECIPILEKQSNLKLNKDFFCGYSPERINPGDKINTLTKILKVTSGSNPKAAQFVDELYSTIIDAGTYKAASIKIAEASKAIENAQRDVNISFMNELALIFNLMKIDTNDVIEAASTKWNFLKFKPGLVGGHCIGVDPYYLTYKAKSLGYSPEVILSGRRLNDNMGKYISSQVIKLMIKRDIDVKNSNVLILGLTFKENCPDIRNTKIIDIYSELKTYGCNVDVYDPWANSKEVENVFGFNLIPDITNNKYDAIILAVAHSSFNELNISNLLKNTKSVVYDSKAFLPRKIVTQRL